MTALVFGAAGQDGHYLVEQLRRRGMDVVGTSRSGEWRRVDVARFDEVEAIVRELKPDRVFHLAARSTTRHDALFENHQTISTGALNVLESIYRHAPDARVFLTGSGVQFKNDQRPIDESVAFEATSPYAVARIQSTYAARYYRRLGVKAYVGYLFHHDSPLRPPNHLSALIARAARRIGDGSAETLEIGDISVIKEWTFAGDTVRGILTLVEQDNVFEAVVGTGEGHSVEEWLEMCFAKLGKRWRDHVQFKPGFRAEYGQLVSSPERLRGLGWTPTVSFEQLAIMMMEAR